jgi:hypothetical protein
MRDSTTALWKLLRSGRPAGCVLYEDYAAREQLIELCYLVAPGEFEVHRTEELEDVFREDRRGTLLLFAPRSEVEALRALDARRDALAARTAPMVLFLFRRGQGLVELPALAGIAAMLRDQELDPEQLDTFEMELERDRFEDEVKQSPEAWLAAWRDGRIPHTPENTLILHQALLLERLDG